ncbi:hypothetical protein [Streptomyces sp. NPDC057781]|uniref:hypothetical protein n=1 Tax=unclassified Streptomyces TaxID=2593676 RepID=UPI00369DFB9B
MTEPRPSAANANLRWALEGALERADAAHALRLVNALAWYWVLRGRLGEARRSMSSVLELAGGAGELHARARVWQVGLTILVGDGEDRAAPIESALKAYGEVADSAEVTWARWFLAHTLCGTGDVSEGAALTGQALEGFRELGDRWGEAAALSDRAAQRLLAGDLAGAEEDAARSVELFGAAGDTYGQLWSVYPRSAVAAIHGDYARSSALQRDALETVQEFGLATHEADLLSGLGRNALLTGDFAAARTYHERARRSAVDIGFRAGEINAVLGLGLGARREGLFDESEIHLRTVLAWHRDVGLDGANALILAELGFIAEARGDASAAWGLQQEGYATARSAGDPRAVALALEGLAAALALSGAGEPAAVLLGAAAVTRAATGAPLPPAERGDVDRATAQARELLEREAFETAFRRGEELGPHEAVGVAVASGRTSSTRVGP